MNSSNQVTAFDSLISHVFKQLRSHAIEWAIDWALNQSSNQSIDQFDWSIIQLAEHTMNSLFDWVINGLTN